MCINKCISQQPSEPVRRSKVELRSAHARTRSPRSLARQRPRSPAEGAGRCSAHRSGALVHT